LTWYALYEAYGTRPAGCEWGSNPDRQKANTKDEEAEIGLLNEGMRFRDLETGTFLTRDPIGYADGPNVYCYVHCNPITHFDAFGLSYGNTVRGPGGVEYRDLDYSGPLAEQSYEASGFVVVSDVIEQSVDAIGEGAAVAGQFVKGTAVGVNEVVKGWPQGLLA
jgi:RHS repeat-associated protein